MAAILALSVLVSLPALAIGSKGYRGVYAALALAGLVMGYIMLELTGPVLPSMTREEQIGAAFLNSISDGVLFMAIGMVLGGTFGTLLYRSKDPSSAAVPATSVDPPR